MALFRSDGWVKSALGQAIAGAQVYVCAQPTDTTFVPPEPLVSVFSDPNGVTPIVQPVSTDGFGHYDFYVSQGTYTIVVVTGGKVQQVYEDQSVGFPTASTTVTSVFGRVGDIVAQSGDYSFFYDPLGAAAAAVVGLAPLASPSLTGIPVAPTAPLATNTTQIATCAFVLANSSASAVASVFGRTGAVTAQSGDYSVGQITGAAPLASPTFSGTVTLANESITGTLKDGAGSVGTSGQILSSTATGTQWVTSIRFPFSIVQESQFNSGGSNVTSFTITFPKTAAASGNTLFVVLSCDGATTFTAPSGWTIDINQQQNNFARLIVMHKAAAADASVIVTNSGGSSFSGFFMEISGVHAVDQSSSGGTANTPSLTLPAITPTANSLVFGMAAIVTNTGGIPSGNGPVLAVSNFNTIAVAATASGGRGLVGYISRTSAQNVSTTPPVLYFPNITLFTNGGVAYSTFSIL